MICNCLRWPEEVADGCSSWAAQCPPSFPSSDKIPNSQDEASSVHHSSSNQYISNDMQDQDDASSSQSQENEAASPAKKMDTAADKDNAPNSSDLHRSVIDSMAEVPKFSEEWFRLKEKEISLRLKSEDDEASSMHADETTPFSESITTADEDMAASVAIIGIEQMPSRNAAPIPLCAAMSDGGDYLDDDLVAKKTACAKPELMHDDLGPDANTSFLHSDSLSSNKKSARSSLEIIEDDSSCPLPLHYTTQGDLNMERKVAESKSVDFSALECDDESANMERPAESTGDIEHAIIQESCSTQQQPDTYPSEASRVSNFDDESIFHPPPEEADTEHEVVRSNVERSVNNGHPFDTPLVRAWAVDESSDSDKSVYMAEELVETPWWKQRRTKLLFAVLVVFVVLAITLGLVISQDVATSSSVIVMGSQSPSMSWTPTSSPTSSPSNAPSSSPTECIQRMHSSMQTIDLGGEVDDWSSSTPKVAVDGSNMIVAVTGVRGYYNETHVKFFSLTGEGVWEKSNSFKAKIGSSTWFYASLSGKTAFVSISVEFGEPSKILVYEQNTNGQWEKVQDPFEFEDDMALNIFSCDIDGDLACISGEQYISGYYEQTYILHQNGSKWIHFDTKNGTGCDVFGDTIAIEEIDAFSSIIQKHLFKYNEIQNALFPIQDPILSQYQYWYHSKPTALSNDYFAFLDDCDEALYIYRLDPESKNYTSYQQLNMEGVFYSGSAWIEMDNDVLVVATDNETFIFVDQDGTWVKSIAIVDNYFTALSGRNVIFVSDGEVRAYSILEDCTQPMPTSSPSFEPSSASPTHSSAPSVSLSPSLSSSPTQCVKKIQLDLHVNDPLWPKVAVDGSNLVVAIESSGVSLIQFYSLANTGEWTRLNSAFQYKDGIGGIRDVALSGNTTLVSSWGSPPLVFEQSAAGEWENVSDPFGFGVSVVDVDGDLACLDSSLFRRNGSKWIEVHNFPTSSYDCSLSGGTIALQVQRSVLQLELYEYNEGQDAVSPILDPIILKCIKGLTKMALSKDYLVYAIGDDTVHVYQLNSVNQTYIFTKSLKLQIIFWT